MWMRFNTKVRYLIKERSAKKLISSYIGIMIILASFSIIFVSAGLADPIPFFGDPDGGGNFLEDPEELEDPEKPEEPEDPEKPEELGEQVDTFEPIITTVTPKDKATINDRTPEIIATYSDDSGIDPSNITLKLNDEDVTPSAEVTDTTITYKPVLPASSNDYMVKLAVSDNFGNIAVKTWSFTLQRNEEQITETIEELPGGETRVLHFEDYEISIREISVTSAQENLENIVVNINKTEEPPVDIVEARKHVYEYYNIDFFMDDVYVEDITTIGAQVTIEFTIPLSWATENYIDLSTVKLMRYCDGWGELTTTFLGTDDKAPYAAYYEAVVPGFSTFAVIGSEIVEITEVTAFSWIIIGGVIASITTILVAVLFKARYIYLEGEHPMEHPKKKLSRKNKLKVEKYQISQKH